MARQQFPVTAQSTGFGVTQTRGQILVNLLSSCGVTFPAYASGSSVLTSECREDSWDGFKEAQSEAPSKSSVRDG